MRIIKANKDCIQVILQYCEENLKKNKTKTPEEYFCELKETLSHFDESDVFNSLEYLRQLCARIADIENNFNQKDRHHKNSPK